MVGRVLFESVYVKLPIHQHTIPLDAGPVIVQPTANYQLVNAIEALA